MGQELSPSLEVEPSQSILNQLSNRFTIFLHPYYSTTPNLKLLNERSTNTKYVLRIITSNNQNEHHKIQELINKKIANKNNYLTKLEQYFFEHEKSYCGNLSKYYLLFNVGSAISVKDHFFMKQNDKNQEQQLIKGLNNLTNGLLCLKNMQMPHGNISSQNVYLAKDGFLLTDPWIAPQGSDLNDRFPSPEKLMKINNKLQDYDPYASDLFSIGMTILQISKKQKLDKIYKKNYTVNTETLIDEINKCPYPKLRQTLKYILLSSENNRKQYINDHQISFKIEQQGQLGRDKKDKGGIKRINLMSNRQNLAKVHTHINQQTEAQPRNFSKENKVKDYFTNNLINPPKLISNHQNEMNHTFAREIPKLVEQTHLRSKSNTKVNFNYTQNTPNFSVPSFISQAPIIPIFQHPRPIFNMEPSSNILSFNNFTNNLVNQGSKVIKDLENHNDLNMHNLQKSSQKSKKISVSDKLNCYYYENVVKSQKNINLPIQKPFTEFIHPSLPNIPQDVSRNKKSVSPQLNISSLTYQKQHNLKNDQHTPQITKPQTNIDSHSAESNQYNQYMRRLDQKINKFQAGVSNAIQNTIIEIQNKSDINKKQSINTVEDNRKTRRLTENYLPSSQIISQSQLSNRSEINLPESCEPIQRNYKSSEPLGDSLLIEINRITTEQKLQKNQINLENDTINTITYALHSQQKKGDHSHSQQVLRSMSQQPQEDEQKNRNTFIHGTQLETVSNLAIPQQASSQEESFDSNLENLQQKGVYCQQYYQNGGYYKGIIKNGERNGHGTFYYRDGGYYEGQWKDNKMNGLGRLYYESGELAYQGQWFKDQFHGRGKIFNDNPDKLLQSFDYKDFENQDLYWKYYEGDLSYDTKEGHGKLILSNGQYYIGEFKNDRPSGRGHFHLLNKKVIHGVWLKGKLLKQI